MKSPQSSPHLHSIAEVATQIYYGEDPWFSLGCFLHDWWCYGSHSLTRNQSSNLYSCHVSYIRIGKAWLQLAVILERFQRQLFILTPIPLYSDL
jgi:hypothetical protein